MTEIPKETSTELRADIERTRNRMSQRIDQIQEQLSPENLKQQAQETVNAVVQDSTAALSDYMKTNSREMATGLAETIRQNPIPAALIGLGVGWLLIEGSGDKRQRPYDARYDRQRYYDTATGREWQATEYNGDAVYRPTYGTSTPDQSARFASQYAQENRGQMAYSPAANQTEHSSAPAYSAADYQSTNRSAQNRTYGQGQAPGYSQAASELKEKAGELGEQISAGAEEARSRVQQVGHQAQAQAEQLREGAHSLADQARDQVDSLGHQVHDYVGQTQEQFAHASHKAERYVQQAGGQLQHSLQDNPLIFGGIALGIGALLGLALPATKQENQLVGATRDQVVESAKTVLHDAQERAEELVAEVQPKLQETTEKVVNDLSQAGRSALNDLQESGKSTLAEVKESGKQAATELSETLSETGEKAKSEAQKVANRAKDEADKVKDQAERDAHTVQANAKSA